MEWWALFDSSFEDMKMVIQLILQLYGRQRIDWLPDVIAPEVGVVSRLDSLKEGMTVSPEKEIEVIR